MLEKLLALRAECNHQWLARRVLAGINVIGSRPGRNAVRALNAENVSAGGEDERIPDDLSRALESLIRARLKRQQVSSLPSDIHPHYGRAHGSRKARRRLLFAVHAETRLSDAQLGVFRVNIASGFLARFHDARRSGCSRLTFVQSGYPP